MKILIIQLRRIGDILLTAPILSYLKKNFPDATVHFLSDPMGKLILETNPHVDRCLYYDKSNPWKMIRLIRAEKYDVVLDFMNNPRTAYMTLLSGARWRVGWRHPLRRIFYRPSIPIPRNPEYVALRKFRMVTSWLQLAGMPAPKPVSVRPELYLTVDDDAFARSWMNKEGLIRDQFVILTPADRHPIRAWPKENYRDLAVILHEKFGKKVYLAWGPGEESWVKEVQQGKESIIRLLPPTSVREMAAIFKFTALVVSNDCGAMHTAVAMSTPTVTLYGPTRPVDWNPTSAGEGENNIAVRLVDDVETVMKACAIVLTQLEPAN